jgi:hypothetical protein
MVISENMFQFNISTSQTSINYRLNFFFYLLINVLANLIGQILPGKCSKNIVREKGKKMLLII